MKTAGVSDSVGWLCCRGNLERAISLFNRAIKLSKTEVEMAHLFSLLDAAIAQSRVAENFGIQVPNMGMMG